MELESLILAAGLGTRMHSRLPKALHPLGGRPLIRWVVDACKHATGKPPFVVIGPEMGAIRDVVPDAAEFVEQTERLGTGHAVLQARQALEGVCDRVLVTQVDMTLLTGESLKRLTVDPVTDSNPETAARFIKAELAKWAPLVEAMNLRAK